jgi:hypothetical protein
MVQEVRVRLYPNKSMLNKNEIVEPKAYVYKILARTEPRSSVSPLSIFGASHLVFATVGVVLVVVTRPSTQCRPHHNGFTVDIW